MTAKSLPRMDEDDRLMPILSHLSLSFLTNISANDNNFFGEQDPNSEKVTADMVDALAVKHFPACQYNLWRRLKRDRHLKHYGRLQFGLFLKVGRGALPKGGNFVLLTGCVVMRSMQALGLPLDEALVYWRRGYGQTMSDDKFNKEYKYNIRHSYGQEGKRTNYPAKR
jgi:DNA primase large subunit